MGSDFLRAEICRIGRSLFERDYVHAAAGNISVRLDATQGGGFLITPTDACLGFLRPDTLAWINETCQPCPQPLDETEIEDLRRHFGARW